MRTDFYIYEHCRSDTGMPFYVGKGTGSRATNFNNRGRYWNSVRKGAGGAFVQYPLRGLDEELALLAEMELIDAYRRRGVRLVNITAGGEGTTGYHHDEETKRKIGQANRHTPKATGEAHPMYGKRHRPESIAAMSASQRAREWGPAHPFYGKKHTPESLAKMSAALKGKLAGAKNPFYGKTHSEESRAKIGAAGKGRKHSPETIAKRREAVMRSEGFQRRLRPVLCVTTGVQYVSISEAARQLNLHNRSVSMVCNGKLRQTGGYVFQWGIK